MAVYPNTDCYFLCEWMLTVFVPRLTGPQQTLTATVQAAALAQTSVTDQEWKDFQNYAQWRNPYYLVYRDYQTIENTDLDTGLAHFYNFEGNSNDSVGSVNGTDNAISYSSSYGKIGQGARNNSTAGYISLGSTSDFSFIQNTGVFSINVWVKSPSLANIIHIMGSTASTAEKGFWLQLNDSYFSRFQMFNGSSDGSKGAYISLTRWVQNTNYNMYTFVGDGSYLYVYINGNLVAKDPIYQLSSGNSTNVLKLFACTGYSGSNELYMDLLGIWTTALSRVQVGRLYNNGAGLSYPF